MSRVVEVPELSLVLLVGASGSGKSTFARRHFRETEVLSSDRFRAWLADDENDQAVTPHAFEALGFVAGKRLSLGRIVVVDATNVQPEARKPLIELARAHDVLPVAIVLDTPDEVCVARNASRPERQLPRAVIRRQSADLRRSLRSLRREGLRRVDVLTPEEAETATIVRTPLYSDKRGERGPFNVIGDVHGCREELEELLTTLGYARVDAEGGHHFAHPEGRKAVFLGDLVDRGPDVVGCVELAMRMTARGSALAVPGNHETRLLRHLRGAEVRPTHGLAETLAQMEPIDATRREAIATWIHELVSHLVLDDGRLVVAHAGMKEAYQGRASPRVREFALYGETTGEVDDYGLPVRADWASGYRGRAAVVYGHTPVVDAEWVNGTLCVDTGCVYGGSLTALRWPEKELVSVRARRRYAEPARPLETAPSRRSAQQEADDLLDVGDFLSRARVDTRLAGSVVIPEANARAALEVASRFCADPRWVVYLPPTMSPSATSSREGLLEHPDEAIGYFRSHRVARVVCQEKHMGSRMVVVIARDGEAAQRRFGVDGRERGVCLTRTGRRFFGDDRATEGALLDRLDAAMARAGLWESLATEWAVFDCELLPWSAKAQDLLRDQYALTGAAGSLALGDAVEALERAAARGVDVGELASRTRRRAGHVARYVESYRRYCWPVRGVEDLRVAPFHLLASEGKVHVDRDHRWHMEAARAIASAGDALFVETPHREVDLSDESAVAEAVSWWEERTAAGAEGMVVKPLDFIARGAKGMLQPAIKCRGAEYLRIIYGPEYPDQIDALRSRGLSHKRALALREFALGVEALERFVKREPLRRVHECALGLLALESEPIDPRL